MNTSPHDIFNYRARATNARHIPLERTKAPRGFPWLIACFVAAAACWAALAALLMAWR